MKRNRVRRFLQQKQYTIASFVLFAAIAAMTGVYMSNKVTDSNQDTEVAQKQNDLTEQELADNNWNQDHLPKTDEEEVESVASVIRPKDPDKEKDTKSEQDSEPKASDAQNSDSQNPESKTGSESDNKADDNSDTNMDADSAKNADQMNENDESEQGEIANDAVKQGENTVQQGQQISASDQQQDTATQEKVAETMNLHFSPKSDLSWPMQGDVIMNYSMDQTVYFATLEQYKYNPAIIIAGKVNEPVNAAATGRITDISSNEETGTTVTMDLGDGYTAIYGQLKEVLYKEDAIVEAGNAIGYIAEPTKYYSVEGSNLYFELQKDKKPVNPMQYIQ